MKTATMEESASEKVFTPKRLGLVFLMTVLIGVGSTLTAFEFNEGQLDQSDIGSIFLGMAFPNLLIAGVMRLFRVQAGKVFLLEAAVCVLIGIVLIATSS